MNQEQDTSELKEVLTEKPEVQTVRIPTTELDKFVGSKLLDRYLILEVLGKGGMGVVYKAKQENLDRLVAIKMLHSHLIADAEAVKRFHREARAVSRVKSPHSVTLLDFGIAPGGQPFLVMEFIEGISLKQVIKTEGYLDLPRANKIFQQVVEALIAAHNEGVIHRDLKPENIMLCSKGNNSEWVEVVDFGISKLKNEQNQTTFNITRLGDVCGSPPYMSPEQCLSAVPVDSRSDIYALGVVLYESLSGQLPFKAKTAVEMLDCHLYMPPSPIKVANPSLSMCDSLNRFFLKALEKDPDKRFQCMKEFAQELNDAILRDASKVRKEVKSDTESFKNFLSDVKTAQVTIKDSDTNQSIAHLKQVLKEDTDEEKEADTTVLEGLAKTIITTIFGPRDSEVKDKAEEYVLLECPYCLSSIEPAFKFCLSCGRNLISPQKLTALRVSGKVFAYPTDIAKSGGNNTMSSVRKDEINAIRAMLVSVLVILLVCCCLMIPQVREIVMQLINSTN